MYKKLEQQIESKLESFVRGKGWSNW